MPSELEQVAREIADKFQGCPDTQVCTSCVAFVESRLSAVISNAKAEAMEEAAELAHAEWYGFMSEGRAAIYVTEQALRRRAAEYRKGVVK